MADGSIVSPVSTKPSSSFLQWQKIFSALLQMLQTQQSQLQTLTTERRVLEDRIHIQQNRWISEIFLFKDRISQMEMALSEAEMERVLEAKKFDLVLGTKQKEAILHKEKLDITESDLEDLRLHADYLALQHSLQVDKSQEKNYETGKVKEGDVNLKNVRIIKDADESSKILQREVRRLKVAFNELSSRKNSEVSALLAERNFVWNQFKMMETDCTSLREELKVAHVNLERVEDTVERLQSTVDEKGSTISRLKAEVAKSDLEVEKLTKELSKLKGELELIKKLSTPVLGRVQAELCSSKLGKENNSKEMKQQQSGVLQATDPAKRTKKVGRCSRKRGIENISGSKLETPRLFTSSFRVPKLKPSSPVVV